MTIAITLLGVAVFVALWKCWSLSSRLSEYSLMMERIPEELRVNLDTIRDEYARLGVSVDEVAASIRGEWFKHQQLTERNIFAACQPYETKVKELTIKVREFDAALTDGLGQLSQEIAGVEASGNITARSLLATQASLSRSKKLAAKKVLNVMYGKKDYFKTRRGK